MQQISTAPYSGARNCTQPLQMGGGAEISYVQYKKLLTRLVSPGAVTERLFIIPASRQRKKKC
jgi:hypothetical protein